MDGVNKLVGRLHGGTYNCVLVLTKAGAPLYSHKHWFFLEYVIISNLVLCCNGPKKHAKVDANAVKVDSLEDKKEKEEEDEKDDNDGINFAANGSIVVSESVWITNWISENLCKLRTDAVKTIIEWVGHDNIHKEYLFKLEAWLLHLKKLALGLELAVLIRKMRCNMSDKLDSMHDTVAWHVGAMESKSTVT